jgi:hypothetical protein
LPWGGLECDIAERGDAAEGTVANGWLDVAGKGEYVL